MVLAIRGRVKVTSADVRSKEKNLAHAFEQVKDEEMKKARGERRDGCTAVC